MAPRALYAQQKATVEQFLNPASPLEVTAARKADRVAWMAYDRGLLVSQGSFEQTKLAARVNEKAYVFRDQPDFAVQIRR